ncbi:hypothetical protein [Maritimibacter sp. UBA3975]|uniref:hypothetical protein n=1 Tax=Maritimibacter sp. UBA3975 TaxID=1946833 RepID=UPI000C0B3DAF|nr:hypothetical protein [Maritimibacter sp. UBA3975]MAM61831.1 hypothetical protein [Maritimibacter sp.]|tara:strand:- start:7829 stop:8839 length:1011 start_codon:yes stop_codon:yes gene_type:complete
MAQDKTEEAMDLGIFGRRSRRGVAPSELLAAALCCLWLAGCAVYFLLMDGDVAAPGPAGFIMTLLAVFLPVAVIWLAASAARSARIMREETVRLQSTIDAMRHSYLTQAHAHHAERNPEVEAKIARLEQAQKQTEQALTTFSTTRNLVRAEAETSRMAPPQRAEEQPSLALEPQAADTAPPLERDDMIRALHFPESAEDEDGFAALRRALQDRKTARLVQAAQDVLTLLSQDGIYMDDLRPDRARPEIWRRFANGHRGREVAALGGIRDRSSLALTAGRMKSDAIFRDAAHHFLRRFDEVFVEFEETATDEEIARMSDTRTARAFMLLGRVTGTFT